jgi:hypothetical protein
MEGPHYYSGTMQPLARDRKCLQAGGDDAEGAIMGCRLRGNDEGGATVKSLPGFGEGAG